MSHRALLAVVLVVASSSVAAAADERFDFERDVAPLLAKRCAGCHNAAEKKGGLDLTHRPGLLEGGDSGAAVVPGDAAQSTLWQRIVADEMPPKNPLPASERAIIQAWLARGAPWSGDPLDPLQYTSDARAGYDWWSLQPVRPVAPPAASSWARNPIDAFIEQKLLAAELQPAPPAERRTWARRLYFDLIGLPPTPSEAESFLQDSTPDAYEQLVDRLLASPAFGERWAHYWLDVVRFGESQGFERDRLRPNAWRYRDWVIDAFNRDLPYDEFARQQLAGDVLRPGDADALVATGFLTAGPWDEVGQKQQSAAMKAVVRQDEIEDLVGTAGQTFLGLTVNCARCHDHKFDPIRQAEYYDLSAALAGVHHGEPSLPNSAVAAKAAQLKPPVAARLQEVESRLAALEDPQRRRILGERKTSGKKAPLPKPLAAWDFDRDATDSVGDLDLELKDGPYVRLGMLFLEGKGYAATPALPRNVGAKTLEVRLQLLDVNQQGRLIGLETQRGTKFDAIVYGDRDSHVWSNGSNSGRRTRDFHGPKETKPREFVQIAFTYHEDGTIAAYRNGRPYGKPYLSTGLTTFDAGDGRIVFGLRSQATGTGGALRCVVDQARVYDRALTAEEVAATAGLDIDLVTEDELIAEMPERDQAERADLRFERDQLRRSLEQLADKTTYAVAPQKPEATYVLHRGNPNDRGKLAVAGGIASLRGLSADFDLDEKAADADRRLRLAEWIADPRNPLFARVIVNRLWQYHFGVGLVETSNDFGFNGGRPSHPELLEWLATELVRSGWSLKHVHRLIVTSATYRQSSQLRTAAAAIDAGNRLLWRKSPQRLEAEALRDALLVVSGTLDRTMHGPSFQEFTTFVRNSQFYEMRDPIGPTFRRRTLYRTWGRSARSQLLDVFDCPDPSTKTPTRAVTTTPLQALSLLNNSFVLRTADDFAARIRDKAGDDRTQQVRQAFLYIFNRTPDDDELTACETLVREHGLAALARVLFNSNELLYVE